MSPAEMRKFRLIERIFRDCCLQWGYEEVRTPTLEYLHLFTSTGTLTPGRLGKVYSFLDWDGWSGERVVLRPDGTIPVARLYIDSMKSRKLARLCYLTNVFIFEETGKEMREKWQCGAELIGVSSTAADSELVLLALAVLKQAGLNDVELKLSHAGVIRALLAGFGLSTVEQHQLFDQALDGDETVLVRTLSSSLQLKGSSSGFLRNLRATFKRNSSELESSLDNFIHIADLLEAVGISYQIDLASGRGFEYYTGVVFQFLAGGEHVGGGGRYDGLIPLMGGGDVPASGFALYLDRLMDLIKPEALAEPPPRRILIKAEGGEGAAKEALKLAASLHKAGYPAEVYLGGREPAGMKWLVSVHNQPPLFSLTDRAKRRKFEVQTADEVLKLLG